VQVTVPIGREAGPVPIGQTRQSAMAARKLLIHAPPDRLECAE